MSFRLRFLISVFIALGVPTAELRAGERCLELFSLSGQPWEEKLQTWGWKKIDRPIDEKRGDFTAPDLEAILNAHPGATLALEWKNRLGWKGRSVGRIKPLREEATGFFQIETLGGRVSLLDPTAFELERIYVKKAALGDEELRVLNRRFRGGSTPPLDVYAKRGYCRALRGLEKSPHGKAARKIARNLVGRMTLVPATVALASCLGTGAMVGPYFDAMDEARDRRDRGESTWLGDHGSNSAGGLAYLTYPIEPLASALKGEGLGSYPVFNDPLNILAECGIFSSIVGMGGGKAYHAWVAAAAAGAIAANVWEEVRIPGLSSQKSQRQFSSGGKEVFTNWEDFASGAGTAVAYWLYHESLLAFGIDLGARLCR